MATCTKCGKFGIKRKKGLAKCKRCGIMRGTVSRLVNAETAKSDSLNNCLAAQHKDKQHG